MKRFLSLGAGVQSSTLALMAALGEVDRVDAAIFADTQWEPRAVYTWLEWLEAEIQASPYPFPVHRVTAGNLRENVLAKQKSTGGRFASIPWHMVTEQGERAMGRRQCTAEYKIKPIEKKKRELLGLKPRQRARGVLCETLIGISTDEAHRMKCSTAPWSVNRWPLVERRMNRWDCLQWMEKRGYPQPPKSSCIGCPYHSDAEWRAIRADAKAWADALEIDSAIRAPARALRATQYMHRSCLPLEMAPIDSAEDAGQFTLWGNECEGMCGV